MESNSNSEARQGLLRKEPSALSDTSIGASPTIVGSPSPVAHYRPGYSRTTSLASADVQYHGTPSYDGAAVAVTIEESLADQGLGIATGSAGHGQTSIPRVPVGSKKLHGTPSPGKGLSSPAISRYGSRDFAFQEGDTTQLWGSPLEDRRGYGSKPASTHQSSFTNHDTDNLLNKSVSASIAMADNGGLNGL
ncbi:MAG: hypothetical protein M1830_010351 [Pleopsidium flavum]|nr:MAG: hypothetical protein M1830_002238 [Pleopsidium flavum]KAI9873963.1 MAG: hypothetical protein M1830_010351 [Pleopsidium flavum]